MATVFGTDMLTIREAPLFVAPTVSIVPVPDLRDMRFLGHLPSVKVGDTYYFVYSIHINARIMFVCHQQGGVHLRGLCLWRSYYRQLVICISLPTMAADMPTGLLVPIITEAIVCRSERTGTFYHRHTNNAW